MKKSSRKELICALIVFSFVSIIFLFPVFKNIGYLGWHDWDQHYFYNEAPRKTLLEYKQFPLWNPYYCGGNVLLAHPESTFLNPFYIFVLLFGAVVGIKIQALFYLIFGMFGMFLLSKHWGLAKYSSYLPSIVFFLSSWFFLRMAEGHTLYLTIAFVPWVFLFYLKGIKNIKYLVIASIFLVLIALGGGTYPFYFMALFLLIYSILYSMQKRNFRPLMVIAIIFVLTFLLGAVKFIPMLEFLGSTSEPLKDAQYNSIGLIFKSLLSRNQASMYYEQSFFDFPSDANKRARLKSEGKVPWRWHEYGAYIGIIAFLLLILGIFINFKGRWPLIITMLVFLFLSLGKIKSPYILDLHGPSRFILLFVFGASLLAGIALNILEKSKIPKYVPLLVVFVILVDLFLVSYPIVSNIFTKEAEKINKAGDFVQTASENAKFSQYTGFLENKGTVNCYERLFLPNAAVAKNQGNILFVNYIGEAYLAGNNKTIDIDYFSPNKVEVSFNSDKGDVIVLNQNYFNGWKTDKGMAINYNGLIAAEVRADDNELTFYYLPNSFIIGLAITIITLAICLVFYLYSQTKIIRQ